MRYGRHLRHRRHSRHERHGNKIAQWLAGPLKVGITPSVAIEAGDTLTISADITGGLAPITYVWKKDGAVVAGQTSDTFTKESAVTGDTGSYTVTATDAANVSVTSSACAVVVT